MWKFVLCSALLIGSQANAQNFSCSFGKQPSCLDYGDKICSSRGKCVSDDSVCFDSYQCGYEGFTCKSNVTDLATKYNSLLDEHNELVDDYNDLIKRAKTVASDLDDMSSCLRNADTLSEAQNCRSY